MWSRHLYGDLRNEREGDRENGSKVLLTKPRGSSQKLKKKDTGFSSETGTKLRELAIGKAEAGCYSQAASSSNDSKTRYSRSL